MSTDVTIPELGESINEGTIAAWLVAVGDRVDVDQPLLELETDKVTAELPSPAAGVIGEILFGEGDDVEVGTVVARIEAAEGASADPAPAPTEADDGASAPAQPLPPPTDDTQTRAPVQDPGSSGPVRTLDEEIPAPEPFLTPAVRRLVEEHQLDPSRIPPTGPNGRLLKGDVLAWLDAEATRAAGEPQPEPKAAEPEAPRWPDLAPPPRVSQAEPGVAPQSTIAGMAPLEMDLRGGPRSGAAARAPARDTGSAGRGVRRVRMTRMRRAIARRLKEVQNTAAILTTFNEVDMKPVMDLRAQYKQAFIDKHGVKLGFMSFFVKASIEALKEFPAVNGRIDGDELVYHDYYDVGVAVSTDRGLVVPILRDADRLGFAEVEKSLAALAGDARDGSLTLEQLSGGTFSITNGGVFGSMLSTPILNPPQVAILGMHNIVERPVVVDGQVVVRPVMYVALSYDHRIVDGAQAVRFLVKIKQVLEDPARLLLEV